MNRERLTITLKTEVLKNLDECVDGSKIRNRSHAVEYILTKHFSPKLTQALILAGGKVLEDVPASMKKINNRPVLEYTIENLRRNNIRNIIISTGEKGEVIKNYFSHGKKLGVKIKYLEQIENNGTIQPIIQAKKLLDGKPFLVYYGDVLSEIDLIDMADFHLAGGNIATIAITSVNEPAHWGVVRLKGAKVNSYLEKPNKRKDLSHLINAGIYIFEPSIFKYLESEMKILEKEVLPKLIKKNALNGYVFASHWYDVGDSGIYKKAIENFK